MFQTTNQLWFQIASHFLAPLDERWSEKVGVPELRRFFFVSLGTIPSYVWQGKKPETNRNQWLGFKSQLLFCTYVSWDIPMWRRECPVGIQAKSAPEVRKVSGKECHNPRWDNAHHKFIWAPFPSQSWRGGPRLAPTKRNRGTRWRHCWIWLNHCFSVQP